MESSPQRTWRAAGAWGEFLGKLCASSELADIEIILVKNIGHNIVWCSLMWLMPLRSLSNCDYEL